MNAADSYQYANSSYSSLDYDGKFRHEDYAVVFSNNGTACFRSRHGRSRAVAAMPPTLKAPSLRSTDTPRRPTYFVDVVKFPAPRRLPSAAPTAKAEEAWPFKRPERMQAAR